MNIEVGDLVKDRRNGDVGVVRKWRIDWNGLRVTVLFATGRQTTLGGRKELLTECLEVIG